MIIMKILINTPDINALGGVANHYLGLINYWTQDIKYHTTWVKKWKKFKTPYFVISFIWKLLTFHPDMVLVNPSMGKSALTRDFLYLKIARSLGFDVSVFIHGFNLDYAKSANWKWISNNLNRAAHIIVLAQQFKDILIEHGVSTDIQLSTTKVPDDMIDDYDANSRTGEIKNILFLSRIEKAKGVYEAVDTFLLLKKNHPHLRMKMVGDGTELKSLKEYVSSIAADHIEFTGGLRGREVTDVYKESDLFFFTSHGEGMPTVVLEAMAFGLPVITRYVGGLCDFFEDGNMGRITDSLDPKEFAALIEPLLTDKEKTRQISLHNHKYAKEHFLASKVTKRMEDILLSNV